MLTYLVFAVSVLGLAVVVGLVVLTSLLAAVVERRFELSPLLRTVLTRERTFTRPFFPFSSLGTEASAWAEELIVLLSLVGDFLAA